MKHLFSAILLVIALTNIAPAQNTQGYRVKTGTVIATQDWSRHPYVEISWKSGQHFGIGKEFKIKPYLSVVTDLAYQELGFSASTRPHIDRAFGFVDNINRFQYLNLQASLKLHLPHGTFRPYVMAGYQGGAKLKYRLDDWSAVTIFLERIRSYDDGPVATIGTELNKSYCVVPFIEASYFRSIRNIKTMNIVHPVDSNGNPRKHLDIRNKAVGIVAGIKF